MSKGLEALRENRTLINTFTSGNALIKYGNNEEIIEKELKALEIIRKKDCLFSGLKYTTQEEYDLLKEVLL